MNETTRPFTAHSFNEYLSENKLMGSACPDCHKKFLPPRAICPHCHSSDLEWVELSGKGKLAAFTSVYIGPTFMNAQGYDRSNPYMTGIVELEEGVKISGRLLGFDESDPQSVKIGSPMKVEFIPMQDGETIKTQLGFKRVD